MKKEYSIESFERLITAVGDNLTDRVPGSDQYWKSERNLRLVERIMDDPFFRLLLQLVEGTNNSEENMRGFLLRQGLNPDQVLEKWDEKEHSDNKEANPKKGKRHRATGTK